MSERLKQVEQLFDDTQNEVVNSINNWQKYLTTASRLYKYSFDDQLLIHAQKPNATACANMEMWNKKMSRWIKSGSKGIALIRRNNSKKPRLEYVFDVADTREVKGAKKLYLWEMKEVFQSPIIDKLLEMYGDMPRDGDFGESIMEMCARATGEHYREFLNDIKHDIDDSFLEGFDELNLDISLRNAVTASTQYMVLTRCGIDASIYLDDDDFRGISDFNTNKVLAHLGNAINLVSNEILVEIGEVARKIDKEISQNPIAKSKYMEYSNDRKQFNSLNHESTNIEEDIYNEDQFNLQQERGLSDTRPDTGTRRSTRHTEQIGRAHV